MPRQTELADAQAAGTPDTASRTIRILLVDDDPQATVLIEMALANAPFRWSVDAVPTATAGLQRILADEHDIYLIDQQLPDRNGIELIREMKSRGADKPFILMTGYGSGALDEEALREGAADYVEKDMVGTHLERSIRYAMRDFDAGRLLRDREEQLRQAQKMEAIGRLAGGVAHDFNNLLTAIVGYADLITERLDPAEQTAREMNEIRKAADSAAALTRQLLSFSRKQFLNPTILDLNDTASGLLQMLPRLIGEHIQTSVNLARNLPKVKADASQMEQILINLVLNARDAMALGGDLTIESAYIVLDQDRLTRENLALEPGPFVMLAVKDTGEGMDAQTRGHAFEPFFTTKPKGKGTGLGLATVYGIVDQSGGGVSITSAPGRGTSVRIYLPPVTVVEEPKRPEVIAVAERGGAEMILLVEDNDSVRDLAVNALRRRGYTVIDKRNAEEAIEWSIASTVKPHLLVTDVVMPGLSGPNLAARLLQQNPHLRLLFMSGYTDDATGVHGGSSWGVPLLQKPFTPAKLAEYVRHALDSNTRA